MRLILDNLGDHEAPGYEKNRKMMQKIVPEKQKSLKAWRAEKERELYARVRVREPRRE